MFVRDRSKARGFTLVELLVVIGIIAVLVGILLPSLSKARESAKTAQCLANLRSIATAAINYSTDYKGAIVPGETYKSGGNVWWWAYLVDGGYLTAQRVPAAEFSTAGSRYAKSVLYCPSAAVDVSFSDLGRAQNSVRANRTSADGDVAIREHTEDGDGLDCWYGVNASADITTLYPNRASSGCPVVHHQSDPMSFFNTMSSVRKSADMVFFFDGQIDTVAGDNASDSTVNRLICRHTRRTRINLAFFDGHASTFLGSDLPGGYVAKKTDMQLTNCVTTSVLFGCSNRVRTDRGREDARSRLDYFNLRITVEGTTVLSAVISFLRELLSDVCVVERIAWTC